MKVYLNYGMGVDSTCILVRWLLEPETRDFDLGDLTVLTAQTGDEYADTKRVVEAHALPLLREHRVRYVQVARGGPVKADGVTVLSDTREPTELFTGGKFKLSDELLAAGTVPAVGNRRCSLKGKGEPNDRWLATDVTGPFRQVMGFNADEQRRVTRDSCYGGDARNAEYPLMKWGWGRAKCEQYLRDTFGIDWPKSCCVQCPFQRGTADSLERMARHPEETAKALYLEYVSLALNPLMPLFASGPLSGKVAPSPAHDRARHLLEAKLAETAWAMFRVRRVYHAKGRADRSVEHVKTGTRSQMQLALRSYAESMGLPLTDEGGLQRCYASRRQPDVYPTVEEMFVAAPADAAPKARPSFEKTWARVTLPTLTA